MNLRFQCMPRILIDLVVFLQGGQHLDSCVFLGANSSYSASNDDRVYLEQSVESPQAMSPRGRVHEVAGQNNAVNSSAEVIIELQVKCC
jgi:vacuolar protein sorting-associated protein 13A/C